MMIARLILVFHMATRGQNETIGPSLVVQLGGDHILVQSLTIYRDLANHIFAKNGPSLP